MKTFEEALETVVVSKRTKDVTPDWEKKTMEQLHANASRLDGLFQQIVDNRSLQALFASALEETCCQYHAFVNIFAMGMRVGMEMEKNEGGIDLGTANAKPTEAPPPAGGNE